MIMIRVDDYPGTKADEFWKHNKKSFERFDNLVQEIVGKKYLLGVIPAHTSDEELQWLGQRNIVVGMHGTDHDERYQNQFSDHWTKNDIVRSLVHHRTRMKDLTRQTVDVYLPPHNAVNLKTLSALAATKFKAFTSGPGGLLEESCEYTIAMYDERITWTMKCLHSNAPLEYGRSDELLERGAVDYLLANRDKEIYLTLHFPWEINIGLEYLRVFLEKIKDVVTDFKA